MEPTRRLLLAGIGATVLAAPALVRASSIMKVKAEFPSGLLFKAYEHIHPASWGVPQSGWVTDNGLPVVGRPDAVWTWDTFLKELKRPDPSSLLAPHPFTNVPYNRALCFHGATNGFAPKWVGWYKTPHSTRRRVASGDA